jgi:hypothetical protein
MVVTGSIFCILPAYGDLIVVKCFSAFFSTVVTLENVIRPVESGPANSMPQCLNASMPQAGPEDNCVNQCKRLLPVPGLLQANDL